MAVWLQKQEVICHDILNTDSWLHTPCQITWDTSWKHTHCTGAHTLWGCVSNTKGHPAAHLRRGPLRVEDQHATRGQTADAVKLLQVALVVDAQVVCLVDQVAAANGLRAKAQVGHCDAA